MKKVFLLFCCMSFASLAFAQSECENMLNAANSYYDNKDYGKAAKMYKLITEKCGDNYGGCSAKLKDCNRKLKEDADFKKCTTVEACNYYLETYPNGRYCSNVLSKRDALASEGPEMEKMAYMMPSSISVSFANTDYYGNILDQYGCALYVSELKYLKPRLKYKGLADEPKSVTLYCKIINPNGTLKAGQGSPKDYTFSSKFYVKLGDNLHDLPSWGNSEGTSFVQGEYGFEIWYSGSKIYSTKFTVMKKESALTQGKWRKALKKCGENATYKYNNGSYKGEASDAGPSGLGMYKWDVGTYYIGDFNSGHRNGNGLFVASVGKNVSNCPNCVYYVGQWASDKKSGFGTCYDESGRLIYYGVFADDKPTETYPTTLYDNYEFKCVEYDNGAFYVGETKDGKRNGRGVLIWKDGSLWYGEFSDGIRNGYGIYMPYKGSVTTGIWKGDTKQ